MSDHAFALGSRVRQHELLSPLGVRETQDAMLRALHEQGFAIPPEEFTHGEWSLRYAEIGDDRASTRNEFLLELVPLLSLVGVRRPFARCAVPVAVAVHPGGSRLLSSTVWGFRGDAGTVGLVAKRVALAAELAAERTGGALRSSVRPIDPEAPVDGRGFDRVTGWKKRR